MHDEAPITDLLQQLQQGEQATTDIYQLFLNKARALAQKRLDPKLKGRVTASSIAHEALGKCIDRVKKMPSSLESRDDFAKMLTAQIKMRLADAGLHAAAKKRDISIETESGNDEHRRNESWPPESKAMANELAVQVVQNIFQEPNEAKRTICVLGILLDYPAHLIQEMVRPLGGDSCKKSLSKNAGQPQYAISTIQLTLRNRKNLLREELNLGEDAQDRNVDQPTE